MRPHLFCMLSCWSKGLGVVAVVVVLLLCGAKALSFDTKHSNLSAFELPILCKLLWSSQAFLEILWRGLRRVAPGAALSSLASAHPVRSPKREVCRKFATFQLIQHISTSFNSSLFRFRESLFYKASCLFEL